MIKIIAFHLRRRKIFSNDKHQHSAISVDVPCFIAYLVRSTEDYSSNSRKKLLVRGGLLFGTVSANRRGSKIFCLLFFLDLNLFFRESVNDEI